MRNLVFVLLTSIVSMLGACVNMVEEHPTLDKMPSARNDAALVYVFKPMQYDHSQYNHQNRPYYTDIKDDKRFLGSVTEGSFFFVHLDPGSYKLACLDIDLKAGQTYYLENYVAYVRTHIEGRKREPLLLCPPMLVVRSAEYSKPIIADLTYTVVKKESRF